MAVTLVPALTVPTSGLVLIQLISGSNLPRLVCLCVGVSVNVELLNLLIT